MRPLERSIEEHLAKTPEEVIAKLEKVPTYQYADVPVGERAIYAAPRGEDWQLPRVEKEAYDRGIPVKEAELFDQPLPLVMRDSRDAVGYGHKEVPFNLFPQHLILHKGMTELIEDQLNACADEYPEEPTYIQREFGKPTIALRLDGAVHPDREGPQAREAIAEGDDFPSLWGNSDEYNPVVASHFLGVRRYFQEQNLDLVSVELPELRGTPRPREGEIISHSFGIRDSGNRLYDYGARIEAYDYQMNDAGTDGARFPLVELAEVLEQNREKLQYLVYARGRRDGEFMYDPNIPVSPEQFQQLIDKSQLLIGPGVDLEELRQKIMVSGRISFDQYMDLIEPYSVGPGRRRDNKISLAALGMGVLATKAVAFAAVRNLLRENRKAKYVIKALEGARTSKVFPVVGTGTKDINEFSPDQAGERLSDYDGLVIVQHTYENPTMEELGLEFREHDKEALLGASHVRESDVKYFVPGRENKTRVGKRIFAVLNPEEKRYKVVGGLAVGTRGVIKHNDRATAVWPIHVEGVEPSESGGVWDVWMEKLKRYGAAALRP